MKAFVTQIYVDKGDGLELLDVQPSTALNVEALKLSLCEGKPLPNADVPFLLVTRSVENFEALQRNLFAQKNGGSNS